MAFRKLVQLSFCFCFLQSVLVTTRGKETASPLNYYTIEIDEGEDTARDVAKRNGLDYILPVGNLKGFHILKIPNQQIGKRISKRSRKQLLKQLSQDSQVKWVQQHYVHEVEKRDKFIFFNHSLLQDGNSDLNSGSTNPVKKDFIHTEVFKVLDSKRVIGNALKFNDPLWPSQWVLFNSGQTPGPKGFDINVMPAWKKNITGAGVVVTIIDDGVDHRNTDLKKNYDPDASFDFNDYFDEKHDPVPNAKNEQNGHGTKCAGEVAMEANNSFCGVGIAYNANIGGIRALDGTVTDAIEAAALTYKNNYIDIYSCCWGPKDNGQNLDGPKVLTLKALKEGAEKGRNGKGNIFVWASGNGGLVFDHCGADGYVNSIFTVAVGAVSYQGLSTFYTEACSGNVAVIPTGGSSEIPFQSALASELEMVTTELDNQCTTTFKGTSSAAPIAAGIIALVLQANPNLTWRDVQHLIVQTCKITDPMNEGWKINGAGYHVHHKYGFGLLDAGRILKEAVTWKLVGPQRHCVNDYVFQQQRSIPTKGSLMLSLKTNACQGKENAIDTLEHVEVTVTLSSICRGDLSIHLTSPNGTKSELLGFRKIDNSKMGLNSWTFMTVHSWGENPKGKWELTITDLFGSVVNCHRNDKDLTSGYINKFILTLWGTYKDEKRRIKDDVKNLQDEDDEDLINLKNLMKENKIDSRLGEAFYREHKRKVEADEIPYTWSDPQLIHDTKQLNYQSSSLGRDLLYHWYHSNSAMNIRQKRSWLADKSDGQACEYHDDSREQT
ncbi:PC3-like endoprotease variant B isoform X1 [Hemitrygon akajei]|uniref:PC3-like endoprotease variant B isoform X1 n=1 Tax=Hemitrygon akajei TaxID=2704970 RepID=UPI003BF9FA4D